MKSSQIFIASVALALCATQTACSVTAKGSSDASPVSPLSDVSGKWATDCKSLGQGSSLYQVQTLNLTADHFTAGGNVYMDAACTQTFPGTTVEVIDGSFKITGADAALAGADDIEMSYVDSFTKKMETHYNIALLQGDKLYVPNVSGLNPQSRPAAVDMTMPYHRASDALPTPAPSPGQTPGPTPVPAPTPAPAPAAMPTELIGAWAAGCVSSQGQYSQRVITVTAVHFDDSTIYYNDAACSQASGSSMSQNSGAAVVEGHNASRPSAYDIDVTDSFSGQSFTNYGLIEVSGNLLYVGGYWGADLQSRPTSLDSTSAFTKR